VGAIELWGGPECTVARVGNAFSDQSKRTGHDERLDDLDRFASLGISALRYPALWERAPQWEWLDERLTRIRSLGLRPIVGLVHHGSGPLETSLLDPRFPERLASYAREVAARYPWVDDWTPVNEPLTTARFSCLYGFWYPHRRDATSFARALLMQLRAVVLAMRAIREVIPHARLVQTDDLGKTHATPSLRYQVDHENERRWVTWDLLCGRRSPIHDWFTTVGIDESELTWFEANPCPPDVVGVNHYLSSERFLDHRLERYPPELHGSNGRDAYVDELAARVLGRGPDGPAKLLLEAWERYRLPIAVTEAHNGCTREEQLRWLDEVWCAAHTAREAGADVRAVTLWSLLGAAGWDQLLTSGETYEPGVFDIRAPEPRPTALATMARSLAAGQRWRHPTLAAPGWWRRPERLWYPPVGRVAAAPRSDAPPLLIIGATGTLGQAFARLCELRGLPHGLVGRGDVDIARGRSVATAIERHRPWAIVNAAGYVRVDDAEADADRCRRENARGPAVLAAACARAGIPLVTFSSDLVFDGTKREPYVESDAVAPLSVYGSSKVEAEAAVTRSHPHALVIRTSAFFGPWDRFNFVHAALDALARGHRFAAADDAVVSPTYVPDLVNAALDLLIDGESGLWHLANAGSVTWHELARRAAAATDVPADGLRAVATDTLGLAALRPRYSALGSERGLLLPSLDDALARYTTERRSLLPSEVEPSAAAAVTSAG
jgi:dTDP-4-dehydrorhamnose reductase